MKHLNCSLLYCHFTSRQRPYLSWVFDLHVIGLSWPLISHSISKAVCSWTCFWLCSLKQWSPLSISDSTLIQGCNFGTVQPVIWSHSPQWLDQPATFAEICFQQLPRISPIPFKSFLKFQNIWFVYLFFRSDSGFCFSHTVLFYLASIV